MEILSRLEHGQFERPLDEWRGDNHRIRLQHGVGAHEVQESETDDDQRHISTTLAPGHGLSGSSFRLMCSKDLSVPGPRDYGTIYTGPALFKRIEALVGAKAVSHLRFPDVKLISRDVNRWRMASRAIQLIKDYEGHFDAVPNIRLLIPRCGNLPDEYEMRRPVVALGFSAAGTIYGGLHALAWSAAFATIVQRLLWRLSASLVVTGFPLISSFYWLQIYIFSILDIDPKPHGLRQIVHSGVFQNRFRNLIDRSILVVIRLFTLAYVLARVYLVVECFINLFNLPAGAYDTPTWSIYFPHITEVSMRQENTRRYLWIHHFSESSGCIEVQKRDWSEMTADSFSCIHEQSPAYTSHHSIASIRHVLCRARISLLEEL